MVKDIYFDKLIFIIISILILTGIIFVYSAVSLGNESAIASKIFKKEIVIVLSGFSLMVFSYFIPMNFWKKFSYLSVFVSIILLVFVLFIGSGNEGIKRWINLGFFNFQPSEFAKLSVIFFIAYFVYRKKDENLNSWNKLFIVLSVPTIISFLIFIEPHKGAAVFVLILSILIISSSYFAFSKVLILGAPVILVFIFFIFKSNYAHKRIEAFLNPMGGSDNSYQVMESLFSFAKGGLFGEGIGAGTQKLYYLPEIHTDYIFALIGEETGFIGTSFIITLFLMLFYKTVKISLSRHDIFTQILGIGLSYMITLQALFHILVNLGLFPPTGFTLPFISYGGSSFLVNCIAAGILLRISKEPIKSIFTE